MSGSKPSCFRLAAVCATISARRTAASSSRAATWASAAAPVGFAYGTVRTPGIRLALGSVMNTMSCCLRRDEVSDDVQVLPRKVLVDEQVFHATVAGPCWVSAICDWRRLALDLRRRPASSVRSAGCVVRFSRLARASSWSACRRRAAAAGADRHLERLERGQALGLAGLAARHRPDRTAVDEAWRSSCTRASSPRRPSAGPSGRAAAAPCRGCRRTCRPRSRATASRVPAPPDIRCRPA